MRITQLLKITAGKRHAWYETDQGFNVRKPLGSVDAGIGVFGARALPASESSGADEAKGGSSPRPAQKCICACHENKLKKSYGHDAKCCDQMNGYIERAKKSWWQRFKEWLKNFFKTHK